MTNAETVTNTATKLHQPSLWKVILHNDDYTPMDFVVRVLIDIFNKSDSVAAELMLTVHEAGKANVMLTTREIATEKAARTSLVATTYGYPLLATAEEA